MQKERMTLHEYLDIWYPDKEPIYGKENRMVKRDILALAKEKALAALPNKMEEEGGEADSYWNSAIDEIRANIEEAFNTK